MKFVSEVLRQNQENIIYFSMNSIDTGKSQSPQIKWQQLFNFNIPC